MTDLERVVNDKISSQPDLVNSNVNTTRDKVAYCHFGSRRPKGEKYGIFSCVIYSDKEATRLAARKVMAIELWQDHQYVTYCQAYWFALRCIAEWQGKLLRVGVGNVLLVTNNEVLSKWILNPRKCVKYRNYMHRANKDFVVGGSNEILLSIGLMKPREEKATRYCKEEFVENIEDMKKFKGGVNNSTVYRLNISMDDMDSVQNTNIEGLNDIKQI